MTTPFGKSGCVAREVKLGGWQFSLADLFVITFTACITLGLIALSAPYPGWMLELPVAWCQHLANSHWIVVLSAVNIVLVTFLAAEATLTAPFLSRRLGWVALVAAVWPLARRSASRAYAVFVLGNPSEEGVWDFLRKLPSDYRSFAWLFGCLVGSFLAVRLAGCRLVRKDSDGVRGGGGSEVMPVASESDPEE